MNKLDISKAIDDIGATMPKRMTGNEENVILAERIEPLVRNERPAVVELLRDWIAVRVPEAKRKSMKVNEGELWFALEVAKKYSLRELRPDIEALIADIHAGKTYLPYYEELVAKSLKHIA